MKICCVALMLFYMVAVAVTNKENHEENRFAKPYFVYKFAIALATRPDTKEDVIAGFVAHIDGINFLEHGSTTEHIDGVYPLPENLDDLRVGITNGNQANAVKHHMSDIHPHNSEMAEQLSMHVLHVVAGVHPEEIEKHRRGALEHALI